MRNPIAILLLALILALSASSLYFYNKQQEPYNTFEISSNYTLLRADYFSDYQLLKGDSLLENQIELAGTNSEFAAFQKENTVYYLNLFDESLSILDLNNFKSINQAQLNPIQLVKPWQFTDDLIDADALKFPLKLSLIALVVAIVAFLVVVLNRKPIS